MTMNDYKTFILDKICYTELVYGRINKKLKLDFSNAKIEALVLAVIKETAESGFQKTGKNMYISNQDRNIRLTINTFTNRIITADRLNKSVVKVEGLI